MSTDVAMLLPRWDRRERHGVHVLTDAPTLMRAARELTWREVPVFRSLMSLRFTQRHRYAADRAVLDSMTADGFEILERSDAHLLVGIVLVAGRGEQVVPIGDVEHFAGVDQPGHLKIAFEFRVHGARLDTETRVAATDTRTRRLFAVYWALIRPFSGLIRHEWLRAIRRRGRRSCDVHGAATPWNAHGLLSDRPTPRAVTNRRPAPPGAR
ncbi:hypothetical protein CLV30_10281 [Haloactinopolyspora alba]|uniref:Uncharacterized protein n=1 Tax=Haloactinopolyspora alba TaxID=648780 RepID=A0A2P8EB49_9ACTN|nr:hypothetical protein [Haloactinopolyspora alba]PSL06695.1 hypothetical protein CLV30_10281 [Haloactinopolyspora alba]